MSSTLRVDVSGNRIRAVRFTKAGGAFIFLTFGLGIGALNSGNNLLYLVFAMLLGMLVINAILSRASLAALTFVLRTPQHCFARIPAWLSIELQNRKKRFPAYALSVFPRTGNKRDNTRGHFTFKIAPQQSSVFVHEHEFAERGLHPLPHFYIVSSFPFGLIEKVIPVSHSQKCTVFPTVYPVTQPPDLTPLRHGDYLSERKGQGVNPYGVRAFHYGDEIRHIHWPSAAKTRTWMIKEFEQEKREKVTLHLVTGTSPPQSEQEHQRREAAVSATASLLVHLVTTGREVGLMINNRPVEAPGFGYIDLYLETLALFDRADNPPPAPLRRASRHSISDGITLAFSDLPLSALQQAHYDRVVMADGAPQ